MTIYRADPKDGVAWVTGGTAGIGRALVVALTRAGWDVAVSALPGDPAHRVRADCAGHPGRVFTFPCDVADRQEIAQTAEAIERALGPIALAVFNAGVLIPTRAEHLDLDAFRQSFDVNLFGVLNGMAAAIRSMDARNRGHIVVMGSASAHFGWPTTAAYGGSKAALNNAVQALRYDLEKMNIRIQIVNPGFVDTQLTSRNPFFMPARLSAEQAAARIMRLIRQGGFETGFPRRLTWILRLLDMLPRSLAFALVSHVSKARGIPLRRGELPPRGDSADRHTGKAG